MKKVSKIISEKGISREKLIKEVNANLVGFSINEELLSRFELENLSEDRMRAIEAALRNAFGYNLDEIGRLQKRKLKIPYKPILYSLLAIAFILVLISFVIFDGHATWEKFEGLLTVAATLISIIGFIIGLDWMKNRW